MLFLYNTLVEAAFTQSIWAGLALVLIFYILKKQEIRDQHQNKREEKYQVIIKELADRLQMVEELKEDMKIIKNILFGRSKQ